MTDPVSPGPLHRTAQALVLLALLVCAIAALGASWEGGWLLAHLRTFAPALGLSLLTHAAALGAGVALWSRLRGAPSQLDQLAAAWALGYLPLFLGIALLVGLGLTSPLSGWLLPGLLLLTALPSLRRTSWRWIGQLGPQTGGAAAFAIAICALGWLLIHAASPPIHLDELQYQLTNPRLWLRHGGLDGQVGFPASWYPGAAQLLYALALGTVGEIGVRFMQLPLTLLCALAAAGLARRFHPRAAAAALAILLPAELFLQLGSAAVSDVATGAFTAATAGLLLQLSDEAAEDGAPAAGRPPWWIAGLLSGLALSTKYTAALFLVPLWMAVGLRRGRGADGTLVGRLGPWLLGGLCTLLPLLPWLLRTALGAGHPLYPMMGMDAPTGPEWSFDMMAANHGAPWLWELIRLPVWLFAGGSGRSRATFIGRLNTLPMLALPALPLLLWPARRRSGTRAARMLALASFIGSALWVLGQRRMSYYLAGWPLVAALAAAALVCLADWWRRGAAVVTAVLLFGAALELPRIATEASRPLALLSGDLTRQDYVEGRFPELRLIEELNRAAPAEARVAMLFVGITYPLERDFLWPSVEDHTPTRIQLHQAGDAEGLLSLYRAAGVTHVLYRDPVFLERQYPALDAERFEAGFLAPARIARNFVRSHLILEAELRGVGLYRLPPP